MKLWIDNKRPAPHKYVQYKTVEGTIFAITFYEEKQIPIELIDIGTCGDKCYNYIELLEWLEETHRNYPIRIHSFDIEEKKKMREIMERNGWEEV